MAVHLSPPECDFCGSRNIRSGRQYCDACIANGSPRKYWEDVILNMDYMPEYRQRAVRELAAYKEKYK